VDINNYIGTLELKFKEKDKDFLDDSELKIFEVSNNNNFLSNFINITGEDNNLFQFTDYVSNNNNINNNNNNNNDNNPNNNNIKRKSNLCDETKIINFLIEKLKKDIDFFKNEENKLKDKLIFEILSDEEKIKIPNRLHNFKYYLKVLENDLKELNGRKHNENFEYTGRLILNDDSIPYVLQFYEKVLNENNVNNLLVDELTYIYSIEKDLALLTIDRIIPNNEPNIYQLSFVIFNLTKDS
jgi:hypothetical protein